MNEGQPGRYGVTFKYDPFGRRIEKSSSATTSIFACDGDNLIEEANTSGAVVARYEQTQNIDEPLAMLRSSATSYYHADGLGSVTSLTNSAGAAAQTYTYDSFGKVTASAGSLTNPFQYTGREMDPETGLYYYRARYYDPSVGRFIGEDPARFDADTNFYRYVSNDPTDLVDPSGLAPDWWNSIKRRTNGSQVSDCVRDILKQYFPQLDFDKVRLRESRYEGLVGHAGETWGNTIYYDPNAINGSVNGIQNLAHELVHVEQFAKKGTARFAYDYAREYVKNRQAGMNDQDAYKNIGVEKEAFQKEEEVETDLIKRFGPFGQPCKDLCK